MFSTLIAVSVVLGASSDQNQVNTLEQFGSLEDACKEVNTTLSNIRRVNAAIPESGNYRLSHLNQRRLDGVIQSIPRIARYALIWWNYDGYYFNTNRDLEYRHYYNYAMNPVNSMVVEYYRLKRADSYASNHVMVRQSVKRIKRSLTELSRHCKTAKR